MASSDGPPGIPVAMNDPSAATSAGMAPTHTVFATSRLSFDGSTCPARLPVSAEKTTGGEARIETSDKARIVRIMVEHRKEMDAPSSENIHSIIRVVGHAAEGLAGRHRLTGPDTPVSVPRLQGEIA